MLKQYGMEKQVLIYINKPQQFIDWRRVAPQMPLMVSLPANVKDIAAMKDFIDQYHPDILDGDFPQYTSDMVAYAQNAGLTVWPDAESPLESPSLWDNAIGKGFTGIQTDHPGALIAYLKQKRLR